MVAGLLSFFLFLIFNSSFFRFTFEFKFLQHDDHNDVDEWIFGMFEFDTQWAEFQSAQNLNSDFLEKNCAVIITTTPWHETWNSMIFGVFFCIFPRIFTEAKLLSKHRRIQFC